MGNLHQPCKGPSCTLETGSPQLYSPGDFLHWEFGGIWTLNRSSPSCLLRMTVQCLPVLHFGGHEDPQRSPGSLLCMPNSSGGAGARPEPQGRQRLLRGAGHSSGGRARQQLGPGPVRCARTSTCTHVYTHMGGDQAAGDTHAEGHTPLPSPPWGRGDKYLSGF